MIGGRSLLLTGLAVIALCLPLVAAAQSTTAPARPPEAGASRQPAESDELAASDEDDAELVKQTGKWLALIDSGKAGDAWDAAGASLKAMVPRQKWISELRDLRKPYGKFVSRKTEQFARSHQLPDAPEGDYVIIEYETVFAGDKITNERVIWALQDGGHWRVAGYQIR